MSSPLGEWKNVCQRETFQTRALSAGLERQRWETLCCLRHLISAHLVGKPLILWNPVQWPLLLRDWQGWAIGVPACRFYRPRHLPWRASSIKGVEVTIAREVAVIQALWNGSSMFLWQSFRIWCFSYCALVSPWACLPSWYLHFSHSEYEWCDVLLCVGKM